MAHFAELNENNEVIYVAYMDNEIITDENGNEIEQLGIDHLHHHHGSNRKWLRTSYGGNFRGKYAGIGDIYREDIDFFISLSGPYPSWTLNETTGQWEAPIPYPDNYFEIDYVWEEENNNWFSIRKYVYDKYCLEYDYSHIQECVDKYKLKDFNRIPGTVNTEDYVVSYEKIKNFLLSHLTYKNWSSDVVKKWKVDYVEGVLKQVNCDLYAIKSTTSIDETEKFKKFMENYTDFTFLEQKNNWCIHKREKYIY